jgi:hypothetical protein
MTEPSCKQLQYHFKFAESARSTASAEYLIRRIRARSLDIGSTLINHYVCSSIRGFQAKPGANPAALCRKL